MATNCNYSIIIIYYMIIYLVDIKIIIVSLILLRISIFDIKIIIVSLTLLIISILFYYRLARIAEQIINSFSMT